MDQDVVPQSSESTNSDSIRTGGRSEAKVGAPIPLGEELPIFCEACGYSLHGLPRIRCERCEVLHFHCPECGHHQPINTLRPAVQKMLGRVQAWWLGFGVFFRLNFFLWLLFAWAGMGYEWSSVVTGRYAYYGRSLFAELVISFASFGIAFGLFGRMFLLRWRRAVYISTVLGLLVVLAILVGMKIWASEREVPLQLSSRAFVLGIAYVSVATGVMLAWPVWVALVMLFLPKRTGKKLLDWQRSLSDASGLVR